MKKWMCALALAACAAAPAFAQQDVKTTLPDRPLKQTKEFDQAPILEGMKATGQSGLCTATYIVGTSGKPKNVVADCASPDFVPYVVRAVEAAEFDAEIVGGYIFESRPKRQTFKFGTETVAAVDPRGEKAPVLTRTIQESDLQKVISRLKQNDKCDLKFVVGADGIPKDIAPNCTVESANVALIDAVKKMKYTPGEKGGQPTDWPGISMPVSIAKERIVNN
jgi:hypothetical protein